MGRHHGEPTNPIDNRVFRDNPSVAEFGGKASDQYIANSTDTIDALRDEYLARESDMTVEEATEKAKSNMAATHSLSSFTSGEIPTDPPWPEALVALGFAPDAKDLTFNKENSALTMKQALAASQAAGATASTSEDVLFTPPVILPHQVKGKNKPNPSSPGLVIPYGIAGTVPCGITSPVPVTCF